LPGLEALSASGKKEGEVKMIRLNGGTVEAHQWSGGVWTKIGEVVGATPKRVEHEGQEYDFVFDVDIAEGAPPLKLPYNTDENPYEAAQKFIDKNELDVGFLQQIVKFIETNTGGVPLGVSKEKAPEAQAQAVPLIAQHDYLSMVSGNASPILNKLKSFCSELNIDFQTPANLEPDSFSGKQFEALLDTLKRLPRDKRFPALDLIRLAVPSAKNLSTAMVMDILACAGVMPATSTKDKIQETNSMLANRTLANLYSNAGHRAIVEDMDTQAISAISDNFTPSHRNLCLAQATYLLNVSVFGRKHDRPDLAVAVVEPLLLLLSKSPDEEVRYRSLVALSTAMQCADEVSVTAKEIYDAGRVLDQVRSNAQNWPRHLQVLDGLDRLLRDARLQ
jgi:phospholipase A-2-activating protein